MVDAAISAFVTLFVIVDPIGLTPIFIGLTRGMSPARRRVVGLRGATVAFALLAVFGLFGDAALAFIGVTLPAFRIAGGLLLFLIAIEMLFQKRSDRRERSAAEAQADHEDDPSVFPIAMPLLAGPGALATMVLLVGRHAGDPAGQAMVFAVMAAVMAVTVLVFELGGWMARILGRTGVELISRLFGMLLAALAVQFVLDGVDAFYGVAAAG